MTNEIPQPPSTPMPPMPPNTAPSAPPLAESPKSFLVTWLLSLLLGFFAVDRFYLGKVGTGLLKLFTFGGFGVWLLIDLILVLSGAQKDKQGLPLAGYEQNKKVAWIVTSVLIVLSIVTSAINGTTTTTEPANEPNTSIEETVEPEAEPVEEVDTVQTWADDTFGTFDAISQSGAGDNLITLPEGVTAGIVTATHDGGSNFVINALDADNGVTGDLLVNTIGAYSGTTVYGFNSFGDATSLEIKADGNWTIVIAPVSAAPALAASGAGDAVYLFDGPAGKLTATHDGSANFIVQEETDKAFSIGLLINTIGAYTGTVPLSSGPSVISIRADGGWTMLAE
jgi:hypothetical protein